MAEYRRILEERAVLAAWAEGEAEGRAERTRERERVVRMKLKGGDNPRIGRRDAACEMDRPAEWWMRTRSDEEALDEGCWFDPDAGRDVCDWIENNCKLRQGKYAGVYLRLFPWQRIYLMELFGWKTADGMRRFRRGLIFVPKKNGKTTLMAALALYALFADGEPAPEVYCAASTEKQATLLYRESVSMVLKNPELDRWAHPIKSELAIEVKRTDGIMQVVATQCPEKKDGLNVSMAIVDEFHTLANEDILSILRDGTAFRDSPLTMVISTAGENEDCPLVDMVIEAKDMLDPDKMMVDTGLLVAVFEAPLGLAWDSEEAREAANPSYGLTVPVAFYLDAVKATRGKADLIMKYKIKFLNWFGSTKAAWVNMAEWDACQREMDWAALKGRPAFVGLDFASTRDLTSAVVVVPLAGGRFAVRPYFWLPEDSVERAERDTKKPLREWARAGLLELTPGNVMDYEFVRDRVGELSKEFDVVKVGYDKWNALETVLILEKKYGLDVVEVPQNVQGLSDASKFLDRLLGGGLLEHDGHRVLRWNAECVRMWSDMNENIRPIKPDRQKDRSRIDGILALIMALKMAILFEPKPKRRVMVYTGD